MAWIYLLIAGLLEVVWAFYMKQSAGFTRLWPSVITIAAMIVSFALLSLSMRTLPLGTAYAVWTGIGAVGAFILGAWFLNEPLSLMRVSAAAMIVGGLILMKLASPAT
jgi:quaternary ammonium compound-resistance protein SugE